MRATLDVGDAAMHRAFLPIEQDLTLALDIVEGVWRRFTITEWKLRRWLTEAS
jgi:hypothetical protein